MTDVKDCKVGNIECSCGRTFGNYMFAIIHADKFGHDVK